MIATLPSRARDALERVQQARDTRAAHDHTYVTLPPVHLDDEQLERRIRAYLAKLPHGLAEGDGRNNTAYRLAAFLTHDLAQPESVARGWLAQWNASNYPPLSRRELGQVFRSAVRTGRRAPGSGLERPRGALWERTLRPISAAARAGL